MLITAVIITWIIGIILLKNRKNLADIWFSVSAFLLGLGLLILFNSTLMKYYESNFSTSVYNRICLLHSIISTIPQYLTPPFFLLSIVEFSGILREKFSLLKIFIYTVIAVPWLTLFFAFPPSRYSYYYNNSNTFWYIMAHLCLIYIIAYISLLLVSLLKSENPREKKQKLLMCIFFIPLTITAYIVCYVDKNAFKVEYGVSAWLIIVSLFIFIFFFFTVKYSFMGLKITIDSYDYSIKKISEGTEILIHSLNREMSKIKACALNISQYYSLNDDAQRDINIINSSINQICEMLHKVNNSLQTFNLYKSSHHLSVLITEAINSISDFANQANIEVIYNQKDDVIVLCDKILITEVIENILINSIEAISNKGQIQVSLSKSNGFASITIKDNGPGIPNKVISRVFDFYFTTKEKSNKNNYGLGLYFCKKVMLLHKGDIAIKSNEGHGTTVFIYFPT